ncbi:hypothetical protein [Castellaniella denitrificans]|jgi:hypothetical protein|uniref:hypothetical protein n=1 Tax=Castellaniella denitrificans TaxID=56119 RepID=UPI00361143C7
MIGIHKARTADPRSEPVSAILLHATAKVHQQIRQLVASKTQITPIYIQKH